MDFRCLKFMLVLAFVEQIWSLPLVCFYNGTSYTEGESVVTEEPCLSCVCQKGALECSLRVCAEYPKVLPPTCFLVHKPNDCCPQLLCEERFNPSGVELRTGFKLETKIHGNDCVINGSVYAEGSAVASPQVCEYCYCVEGEMKCIKPRCLKSFEGCKPVYEKSSCCPTHFDCRDVDVDYLTTQIKNFAKTNPTVSSDSMSTDFGSDEEYIKANESIDTGFIKTEETPMDEFANTTTEETNIEETTLEPEKESTIPLTEDWVTTTCETSSHTTKTENFNEESTTVAYTEATTFESEMDVNVSSFTVMEPQKETPETRSKIDFSGGTESFPGNSDNSSQNIDDFDSYDYSEPELPPSLPNLVIFPFVAADAVVKDDRADVPANYEKEGIERIDTHPVFYKDFSPPEKTEGGFVPKEPSKSDESFHKYAYFKEQIEPPSAGLAENSETQVSPLAYPESCVPDDSEIHHREILAGSGGCMTCTCQRGAVVCQDFECPYQKPETIIFENQRETGSILESDSNVKPVRFREAVRPDTETQAHFILKDDLTELNENYQTKRPVTVTYKNFVVDFYPNYLITTARGQSGENVALKTFEENPRHSTQITQNTMLPLATTGATLFSSLGETNNSTSLKTTRETSTEGIAISTVQLNSPETSFAEEFAKSFLSKETKIEKTTAMVNVKHKYSSKIKGEIVETVKLKNEEMREKATPEMSRVNSTHLYSRLNSIMKTEGVTEKTKNQSLTQKPLKKISFDQLSSSVKPTESKNTNTDFSESLADANISSESRNTTTKPNALLKLAGCNIYGMMYRVGKIITELSGPCLECLCTELGVQCRPLKC